MDLDRYLNIKCPALIEQKDRMFYYRISQRLNDPTVHALFTTGFFFAPKAHVSVLATPDAFSAALSFAGRGEGGDTLLQHDLYELGKRFRDEDMDLNAWLYGEEGDLIPECLQEVINGELPIDLACLLLLVSQPDLSYHWLTATRPDDAGLGATPWIDRLRKADQMLRLQRPMWRTSAQRLSHEFWHSLDRPTLAPATKLAPQNVLF